MFYIYINHNFHFQFIFFVGIFIMVVGTLANLYAIQQSFSTMKAVEKDNVEAKNIISIDSKADDLIKQQLNVKSMYLFLIVILSYLENCLELTRHIYL